MGDTTNHNNDLRLELVAEPTTDAAQESPLQTLRRVLRGRAHVFIPLTLVLALLGGLIGYHAVPPDYESTGIVRVEGALPAILYVSQENQAPWNFDMFVKSQATLLQSRQVLEATISRSEMQEAGWPQGPNGIAALQNAQTVWHGKRDQLINVSVRHRDPALAQLAVNAILETFAAYAEDPSGLPSAVKEQMLVQREQELDETLRSLRTEQLSISDHYGFDATSGMHLSKIEELMAIDRKLTEISLARTQIRNGEPEGPLAEPVGVATNDGRLSRFEQQEHRLMAEIETMRQRYGEGHSLIRELNRQLEAVRIQKQLHQETLASMGTAPVPTGVDPQAMAEAALARLDALEARYVEMRVQVREETAELGIKRVALLGINEQIDETKDRLAETRKRLDELRVETNRADMSRVRIAARGELPVAPVVDRRRGIAAAGALLGMILGTGLLLFTGYRDRRIRYIDELEAIDEDLPVIGLLPNLARANARDEERSTRTIHQLRNFLELKTHEPDRIVHTFTSAERGEGKTSVALATATSFAGAGRRTLLIDADISHGTLTRELGFDEEQGLCEAIGPHGGRTKVHPTGRDNLWAMPVGVARQFDPQDLSRDRLVLLLDALRARFDAIIIDTGPILTSVEACLIAALSDRVVAIVRRHEDIRSLRAAIARLGQVGAVLIGTIFNRSADRDFTIHEHSSAGRSTGVISLLHGTATAKRSAPTRTAASGGPSLKITGTGRSAGKRAA